MERTKQDYRLYSTKKLLKSIPSLRAHLECGVESKAQLKPELLPMSIIDELRFDRDLALESIIRSKKFTVLLMAHVESVVNQWLFEAKSKHARRRCRITEDFYFYGMSVGEIAELRGMTATLVRADLRDALEELSPMFFGSGGVFRDIHDDCGVKPRKKFSNQAA